MRRRSRRLGGKTEGMAVRHRRRSVERRLRRHDMVSIGEIVEAFCVLERTPAGLVPADGTIEALRRKVAEVAAARSLLPEPVPDEGDVLRSRREASRSEVPAGAGAAWYVVAVADDADFVQDIPDVITIRRVRGALLASVPPETAHRLRSHGLNLHVYEALEPAVAAFRLFEPS
jgi:hypothetical protein